MDLHEGLKALAHPTRIEMLVWMKQPAVHFPDQSQSFDMGVSAGQFERCGLSQSTVSAHLATLQRAGLVISTRIGQWVFYRRNEEAIGKLLDTLNTTI